MSERNRLSVGGTSATTGGARSQRGLAERAASVEKSGNGAPKLRGNGSPVSAEALAEDARKASDKVQQKPTPFLADVGAFDSTVGQVGRPPVSSEVELTFGELAAQKLAPELGLVVGHLRGLGREALPHDPTLRPARKELLKLRDLLDIFVHLSGSGEAGRTWRELRRQLDEGYELLGHYKDLWESQGLQLAEGDARGQLATGRAVRPEEIRYDSKQVEKLRARFFAWREQFLEPATQARFGALFERGQLRVGGVERGRLPRFFWGAVDFVPSQQGEGVESLRQLARGLLRVANREYEEVKALKTPRGKSREATFHDFRKRLRSVWNLLQYFPNASGKDRSGGDPRLLEVIMKLGEVEDRLVALHLAETRGDKPGVRAAEREFEAAWDSFTQWRKAAKVGRLLKELLAQLEAPSPR